MRLLVTGPREYKDYALLWRTLELLRPTVLIHGAARGFDTFAADWAKDNGVTTVDRPYPDGLGKAGGPLRNLAMLDLHPDLVLAGSSMNPDSGTNHCVRAAVARGIPVLRLL